MQCVEEGKGRGGVVKSHTQMLHPKEEQHASPSGHLFSQVCSPSVIKIGAAHTPEQRCTGTPTLWVLGHGCKTQEQLCYSGADGSNDESLSKRGKSKRRRKGRRRTRGVTPKKFMRPNHSKQQKTSLRRVELF